MRSIYLSTTEIYKRGGVSTLVYIKYAGEEKEHNLKINKGRWYSLIGRYK
jgi:hypothetical protein